MNCSYCVTGFATLLIDSTPKSCHSVKVIRLIAEELMR